MENSNELKIEIEGESHTFCNALQKVLLEDNRIEMAGYSLPHLLVSNPTIYIRIKDQTDPKIALQDAAKKLRNRSKEFMKTLQKALET
jgi:DNA-directed RNA polymerase subunit L